MRKSELHELIAQPASIGKGQISDLQDLLSEYPYFTSAQLLLAKAFHQSENINFEKQLRLSAAYAGDRSQLHQLILGDYGIESELEAEAAAIQNGSDDPPKESIPQDFPHPAIEQPFGFPEAEAPTYPADGIQSESEGAGETSFTEAKELDEEAKADQAFLDSQIMTAAINSSIMQEVEEEQGEDEAFFANISTPLNVTTTDDEAESFSIETREDDEKAQFDESEGHTFSDWLSHLSGRRSKKERAKNSGLKKIAEQVEQIQKKAEFYSASKMARLSVQESDDLVTETLANVFEAQGKHEKAIQAYQKLSLKFPEKKVYFAGRINAVEKKLKS